MIKEGNTCLEKALLLKRRTAGSGVWLQIINQIHQQNHA